MMAVLTHAARRRRVGLAGWSLGLAGVVALLAVAYPTVRDNAELDKTFANLPPAAQAVLGLDAGSPLTSPVGYLNSQFFANVLPVMLLVFGIGFAAWTIAGDEAAGTLELLLANPVSRRRVTLERAGALLLLLAALTAATAAALLAAAHPVGLDNGLPPARIAAATIAAGLLALTYAALAFAVGAATGSRPAALAAAAGTATAGFIVQGLGRQVSALRPIRAATPWHWLIDSNPLHNGLTWQAWALPVAATTILVGLATIAFSHRDLH